MTDLISQKEIWYFSLIFIFALLGVKGLNNNDNNNNNNNKNGKNNIVTYFQ